MDFIRGLQNLKSQGFAVTIGNFDGVHLGHQIIIDKLNNNAKKLNIKSLLISFNPSPKDLFSKESVLKLTNFHEKYELLKKTNLDKFLIINFNKRFANLSAKDFIKDILVAKLNIKYCLIGDDFRFGKNRLGDFDLLKKESQKYNFIVERITSVTKDNIRVSSSNIRKSIINNDFNTAEKMLGHKYFIIAKVIHGDKKGRAIGFPTINVNRKNVPFNGVYAVNVIFDNKLYQGVANIGNRPTLNGTEERLEVHIFNFNKEIYGEQVKVIFKAKIRDERKFSDINELKKQIAKDCKLAMAVK